MNHVAFAISGGLNFGLIYVLLYLIRERMRTKSILLRKSSEYDLLKWEIKEYKRSIEESVTVGINLPPMTKEEAQELKRLWRRACITTPLNNRNSNELYELYEAFRERTKEKLNSGEAYMKGRPLTIEEAETLEHDMNKAFNDVPTKLYESMANEQQPHN